MRVAGVNGALTLVGQLRFSAVATTEQQSQRRKQSRSFDARIQPNAGGDAFVE